MYTETIMKKFKAVPRQTLLFITFLLIATIALLIIAIYSNNPTNVKTPEKQASFTIAQTSIFLQSKPVLRVNPNSTIPTYGIDVNVSTKENKVTGIQLELSYDPKVLKNVDILPGSFFEDPMVLLKKVDQVNGRISLVLGVRLGQKGVTGLSRVATITFQDGSPTRALTDIVILPKTQVSAEGTAKSVLKVGIGAKFDVGPLPSSSPKVSPTNQVLQ